MEKQSGRESKVIKSGNFRGLLLKMAMHAGEIQTKMLSLFSKGKVTLSGGWTLKMR